MKINNRAEHIYFLKERIKKYEGLLKDMAETETEFWKDMTKNEIAELKAELNKEMELFDTRRHSLINNCEKLRKYPDFINNKTNTYKRDEIKVLRQTFSKFIVDYNLQGGFIEQHIKYMIEQL